MVIRTGKSTHAIAASAGAICDNSVPNPMPAAEWEALRIALSWRKGGFRVVRIHYVEKRADFEARMNNPEGGGK